MSTEFVTTEDADAGNWDNTRFVRFAARGRNGRGPCFEFGNRRNFEEVVAMAEMGWKFTPGSGWTFPIDDPEFGSPAWFARMMVEGRVTFGRFPITVAIGSDAAARFRWED